MKKWITALAIALVLPAAAQMDDEKSLSPEEKAKRMTEMMTGELGLSADQKEKVHQANLEMVRAYEAKENNPESIQKTYYKTMEEILSQEQYEIFIERQEREAFFYQSLPRRG